MKLTFFFILFYQSLKIHESNCKHLLILIQFLQGLFPVLLLLCSVFTIICSSIITSITVHHFPYLSQPITFQPVLNVLLAHRLVIMRALAYQIISHFFDSFIHGHYYHLQGQQIIILLFYPIFTGIFRYLNINFFFLIADFNFVIMISNPQVPIVQKKNLSGVLVKYFVILLLR